METYYAISLQWSRKLYSLTRARKKYLLGTDTKLWLFFIGMLILFFMLVDLFISVQIYSQEEKQRLFEEKKMTLEKEIASIEASIRFITEQERLGSEIGSNNILLKDSIANLFALVPDQIHLTKAMIGKNTMELYGYTPSKSIYNELLMPPLKSIFNETNVVFYPLGNGWYRFVSYNKSKEDFLYEKQ